MIRVGELQRQLKKDQIPVIIVFEGWGAAGRGLQLNKFISALDPRGFTVHSTHDCGQGTQYPYMAKFWRNIPARGWISFFDRSWYSWIFSRDCWENETSTSRADYDQITSFERQLASDDYIIIKLFLHISEEEQKKRLKAMKKLSASAWRVTDDDWHQNDNYEKCLANAEEMIVKTDTHYAPWTIVPAHDKNFATVKIFRTVIETIENKIKLIQERKPLPKAERNIEVNIEAMENSVLDKVDLTKSMDEEEYKEELKKLQQRIRKIEHIVYTKNIPLIVMYEGWDAAGKGSNIKRLIEKMDPRGYEVVPIGVPNDVEKNHHYLWRFWKAMPYKGKITIFDRSWYGRVLVERVEGLCSPTQWQRAYKEINEMEEQIVNFGGVLVKFWLHIDKDVQLERFTLRENTPNKKWKITPDDWRNREKWDDYKMAVDEMIYRTSTIYAPWHIIEGNSKYYARIKTLKTVVKMVEKRFGD